MLKQFQVKNYRNFKETLKIDFSDINGYQFSQDCITDNLISKMIIYGKNGTGKTNLGHAICDLKYTLFFDMNADSSRSFIANADSDNPVTDFSYTFLFNNRTDTVTYEYSKRDMYTLVSEKLSINHSVIFDFSFSQNRFIQIDTGYFHNKAIPEIFQSKVQPSLSFLRWCANNGTVNQDSVFMKIYRYASDITQVFTPSTSSVLLSAGELEILENSINSLEDFLSYMGIPCRLSLETLPDLTKELYFVFENRKIPFISNASSGTLSLFNFYIRFLMPAKKSSIFYFDEFDAFFHHELSLKIVSYIKEKYKDSLVIFTTHNTNLMSNRIMRPDTLFIMTSSGQLTPLCKATDRELREGHNLGKLYMNGEFNEE